MKKLLIVVDYQNDFVDGALGFKGAEDLAPLIRNKIELTLKEGGDLIYTLDTHQGNYMDTMEGKKLPVPHCIEGSKGWEIYPLCDYSSKAVKIFKKPTFPSLELANYLSDKDYDEVELCGLVSHICVISNAVMVKSALPNAKIIVDAKATSSYDKKNNAACLDVMKSLHIDVINY